MSDIRNYYQRTILNSVLKRARVILLLSTCAIMMISCELDRMDLSCDNCWEEKPTEGILAINLSLVEENDSIPVTVYKGKIESGNIFLQDTISKDYLDIWVPVGYFYTVVAEYKIDSITIRAVDGDKVDVYLDETNCTAACYRARDGEVDCKLK